MKNTKQIAFSVVVTALYIVISLVIAPFSFGLVQFRLAEMFNHLIIFSKRYIIPVVLGCFIVNMFSPFGIIDMVVGTAGTLISGLLTYLLVKFAKSNKKVVNYTISTLCQIPGILIVALELVYFLKMPFLFTFGSVLLGEMVSMIFGAFVINYLTRYIDFEKGEISRNGIL